MISIIPSDSISFFSRNTTEPPLGTANEILDKHVPYKQTQPLSGTNPFNTLLECFIFAGISLVTCGILTLFSIFTLTGFLISVGVFLVISGFVIILGAVFYLEFMSDPYPSQTRRSFSNTTRPLPNDLFEKSEPHSSTGFQEFETQSICYKRKITRVRNVFHMRQNMSRSVDDYY